MNREVLQKRSPVNYKSQILILTFASLLCASFSSVLRLWRQWILFGFFLPPQCFLEVWEIAAAVLLIICISKSYDREQATILVTISLGIRAVYILMNTRYDKIEIAILYITLGISFIVAALDALRGFSRKSSLILACVVGLTIETGLMLADVLLEAYNFERDSAYLSFSLILDGVGNIAFYIGLLLLALKNKNLVLPNLLSQVQNRLKAKHEVNQKHKEENQKRKEKNMPPEQALKVLKEKFDAGSITEAEYQSRRSEIIKKL